MPEYLRRAAVVGITWPAPAELDDAALEVRLFSPPFVIRESPRPQPDWPRIYARRPEVTLLLLWQEYRAGQPEGYPSAGERLREGELQAGGGRRLLTGLLECHAPRSAQYRPTDSRLG